MIILYIYHSIFTPSFLHIFKFNYFYEKTNEQSMAIVQSNDVFNTCLINDFIIVGTLAMRKRKNIVFQTGINFRPTMLQDSVYLHL